VRILKHFVLLITLFYSSLCFSKPEIISPHDHDVAPLLIGAGISAELTEPHDHLPGAGISLKNYFSNRNYSLLASIDFFPELGDYKNQLDISTRLEINFLRTGEVSFNVAPGPALRVNFGDNTRQSTLSIHASTLFAMEYRLNKSLTLETALENKIGFSHRPDIVFSFKIYWRL